MVDVVVIGNDFVVVLCTNNLNAWGCCILISKALIFAKTVFNL